MAAGAVAIFLSGCQHVFWWRQRPEAVTVVDRPPSPRAVAPAGSTGSFARTLESQLTGSKPQPQPQADPQPLPAVKKFTYPVALAVPGRENTVLSPFNQRMVSVEGFKSGALVADPHYPLSDKKFFRVP